MPSQNLSSDEEINSEAEDMVPQGNRMNYSLGSVKSTSRGGRPLVKRANHNELERKRRQHQKIKLNELKEMIPGFHADKPSVISIIQRAKEHILELRAINMEQAQVISILRKKHPSLSIPGPNFLPPNSGMMSLGDFGMGTMPMLNHPSMYPSSMNPMVMLSNPMSMNANLKHTSLEQDKMRHDLSTQSKTKESEGDSKGASPNRQASQRSSGSEGVSNLQRHEADWPPGVSFDPSMMGFDPNAVYLRKHRSVVDQDFDIMKRALNDRRDSFATMLDSLSRPSDPNIIPMNPYHRESIAALYNYGFYNVDDKDSAS